MFLSHTDGKTTSTIKVNIVQDLLMAAVLTFIGSGLVICSILHPFDHYIALSIGSLLLLSGYGLGHATLRLILRGWRTYDSATRKDK